MGSIVGKHDSAEPRQADSILNTLSLGKLLRSFLASLNAKFERYSLPFRNESRSNDLKRTSDGIDVGFG